MPRFGFGMRDLGVLTCAESSFPTGATLICAHCAHSTMVPIQGAACLNAAAVASLARPMNSQRHLRRVLRAPSTDCSSTSRRGSCSKIERRLGSSSPVQGRHPPGTTVDGPVGQPMVTRPCRPAVRGCVHGCKPAIATQPRSCRPQISEMADPLSNTQARRRTQATARRPALASNQLSKSASNAAVKAAVSRYLRLVLVG